MDARMPSTTGRVLEQFYNTLRDAYGEQHWWPGDSPTEVAIGAILVQNTNWRNVERAISNLSAAGALDWARLRDLAPEEVAGLIRPAGYHRLKTRRLKNFVTWLWERGDGDLENLRGMPLSVLREELLGINGVGPETADSILLYALEMPTFVVDTYTARVAIRHGLLEPGGGYAELKALFEDNLPEDVRLFNEYHALLVAVGKRHCKPQARCEGCPLEPFERAALDC
jgi:endonuclease-3 related protein